MVSMLTSSVADRVVVSWLAYPPQCCRPCGGFMVSMLTSSVADRGFEPWLDQTKDYQIICFSSKQTVLRRKSRNWLAQYQDSVS